MKLGTCRECGGEAIGKLCSFCSGERKRRNYRMVDAETNAERFRLSLLTCAEMIHPVLHAAGEDEGRAVIACLMMVEALLACTPELPPLEFYLARVLELPKPKMPLGPPEKDQ